VIVDGWKKHSYYILIFMFKILIYSFIWIKLCLVVYMKKMFNICWWYLGCNSYVIGCCSTIFIYIYVVCWPYSSFFYVCSCSWPSSFLNLVFLSHIRGLAVNVSNSSLTQMGTFCTCSQAPWMCEPLLLWVWTHFLMGSCASLWFMHLYCVGRESLIVFLNQLSSQIKTSRVLTRLVGWVEAFNSALASPIEVEEI